MTDTVPASSSATDAEFGTMATWTVEAVQRLGSDHALPAACRGTGSPAALMWLCDRMRLGPACVLLDVGAGLGGPAAFARLQLGLTPVLVDPEPEACRGSEELFGLDATTGDATALPLPPGCVDAAWSLGSPCTIEDQRVAVQEMVRVVRPGGRLGLLVFCRTGDELPAWVAERLPDNDFPTEPAMHEMLANAGLSLLARADLDTFPEPDDRWTQREDAVRRDVADHHGDEPAWRAADDQERAVGELVGEGLVRGVLLVAGLG